MDAVIIGIAPFIVSWLTGLIKNHALSTDAGKALVRLVCAVLSLVAAALTVWVAGGSLDANLVNAVLFALFNFLGATGIFHLRNA